MKTEKKKRWGIKTWAMAIFLHIWVKVFYIEKENEKDYSGWFVRKRPITMIILAPVLIPLFMAAFMFYGAYYYVKWSSNWYYSWITGRNTPLTFEQKTFIKRHLYLK